jgi:hypothetical protein
VRYLNLDGEDLGTSTPTLSFSLVVFTGVSSAASSGGLDAVLFRGGMVAAGVWYHRGTVYGSGVVGGTWLIAGSKWINDGKCSRSW